MKSGGFDRYIKETDRYVEKMRDSGRPIREFTSTDPLCPSPFKVGPGTGIIVKRDTYLELGSPATGSCAFVLYSNRVSLVHDGRVRLIGPDVPESPPGARSFGQVIIAGGETLTDKDYNSLVQSQYTGDKIVGYMVRSMPGFIWSRISNHAVQKGFSFGFLGRALVTLVKAAIPKVTAVEVVFVTSNKADVDILSRIEVPASRLAGKIKSRIWKEKGIDISDCPFGGHCGACKSRSVCDRLRKVSRDREKGKRRGARRV
jgi:CO dehydrogenase/acetyl-CoA synthase beta subunit